MASSKRKKASVLPPASAAVSPAAPTDGTSRPRPLPYISLLIVAFALALRLWGVGWALPNTTRFFSYHPDESVVVGVSQALNPFLLLVEPGFYNYGSLSLLLNAAVIHLGQGLGLIGTGPSNSIPSVGALLAVRLLSAGLGAATCGFLLGAGRLLYGRTAGITAALLYAISPLAVQHAHFATVDVPAVFWISGSLYFSARYWVGEKCVRDLLWAGLWAGFAAATKYNAGLVLLAGVVSWLLVLPRERKAGSNSDKKRHFKTLTLLLGGALLGFLIGCPGVLLNFPAFQRDFAAEAFHVSKQGHGDVFVHTPPGFIYHIGFNLFWGMGWPLTITCLVGFAYALFRRRPGDLILLAFALPYYLLIGLSVVKFARYTLPLFPPLLLFVGALVPPKTQKIAPVVSVAIGSAGAFALLLALALDNVMTLPDTRDRAADFIKQNRFASVGFAVGPWFFSPPLNPLLAAPNPQAAKKAARETQTMRLVPAENEWDAASLSANAAPQAIALSSYDYGDGLRARPDVVKPYLTALQNNYPAHEDFVQPLEVFGLPIGNVSKNEFGLPLMKMPHDMQYPTPCTTVFHK